MSTPTTTFFQPTRHSASSFPSAYALAINQLLRATLMVSSTYLFAHLLAIENKALVWYTKVLVFAKAITKCEVVTTLTVQEVSEHTDSITQGVEECFTTAKSVELQLLEQGYLKEWEGKAMKQIIRILGCIEEVAKDALDRFSKLKKSNKVEAT